MSLILLFFHCFFPRLNTSHDLHYGYCPVPLDCLPHTATNKSPWYTFQMNDFCFFTTILSKMVGIVDGYGYIAHLYTHDEASEECLGGTVSAWKGTTNVVQQYSFSFTSGSPFLTTIQKKREIHNINP